MVGTTKACVALRKWSGEAGDRGRAECTQEKRNCHGPGTAKVLGQEGEALFLGSPRNLSNQRK